MTVYQTLHAEQQLRELRRFYLERERYDAYRNLLDAVRVAKQQIEIAPERGATHPRPYPRMAEWGYLWIEVHSYWFGWSMRRGFPVITNIFYRTANMPGRAEPDDGALL